MNIEQLKRKAAYRGHVSIQVRSPWIYSGVKECRDLFTDITHYFDANMDEIGMVARWNDTPVLFDPPRKWSPEFRDRLRLI